ncbi:hypothetical protein F511_45941 [Dorcoceras hygrometricum]|uniref:Uncharacterized protein n=1 Tax=Dorcoceras hygrometricum TaxID=472368 RepID=A0A2Z6ZUR8_9LAMI|nr:hypothetical protein F511_45941 [Dorcoceras hygrometricum]
MKNPGFYLSGVKFHCKASGIPERFRASSLMDDSGESKNKRCLNSRSPEEISTCKVSAIMSDLKKSLGTCTSSMNNTFWDPLTVKVSQFLHQMVIFKEDWACQVEESCIIISGFTSTMYTGSRISSRGNNQPDVEMKEFPDVELKEIPDAEMKKLQTQK